MSSNFIEILNRFPEKKILVIGDMLADIYLEGEISRISREAPVLVLLESNKRTVPGGAANVVNNVATLGGRAYAGGIVGADLEGDGLKASLSKGGTNVDILLQTDTHFTITKTRVIAGGRATVSQQVVRIDREAVQPLSPGEEDLLMMAVESLFPGIDGVVLSDYGSGTITERLKHWVIDYCKAHNVPTMVDSRYDIASFVGVDYIKQNDAEISQAVGKKLSTPEELLAAGQEFLATMQGKGILITRGEEGMLLVEADGKYSFIPVSDKSEVFDVSGAGDTCVATFITAVAAGGTPYEAAVMSNYASGIAVRKMGTATVSAEELKEALIKGENKG